MSYKIDPVKATSTFYKSGGCGINAMNDACFGVCAAFKGTDNNWNLDPNCELQCEKLIEVMRENTYGMDWCDHHAPMRPVNWDQAPHFFPDMFNRTKNVETALRECEKRCKGTPYPEQCSQNCKLDSYAVVPVKEGYDTNDSDSNDDSRHHHHHRRNDDSINFKKYEKAHPAIFWIGVAIATVFIVFIVYVLFRFLVVK